MIIRGKIVYVYDIEVFQNIFHCSVKNTETNKRRVQTDAYEQDAKKRHDDERIKIVDRGNHKLTRAAIIRESQSH